MTQTNQDKRRLAEAMGWELVDHCNTERWIRPGSLGFTGYLDLPFDPFTDANDDYAVLEWMRKDIDTKEFDEFRIMTGWPTYRYQIGDYARAALKEIGRV